MIMRIPTSWPSMSSLYPDEDLLKKYSSKELASTKK